MTKHRGGSSLLALAPPPPVITGLSSAGARAQRDHHLDSRSSNASLNIQRFSSDQTWHCSTNPLPEFGAWLDKLAISQDHRTSMDKVMRQESCYTAKPADHTGAQSSWDQDAISSGGKKKNYQRYPKPPYSYLAMIAMVIQNSPEKKLTLSEILKEISALFPFFKGNYKGWRDSVRHNLSSYDCFVKVLKDPGKPQGKGNFWTVEVSRVPVELLKRQNTAVSRQDETIFAQDLTPYIFQGYSQTNKSKTLPTDISSPPVSSPSPAEGPYRPKLDSTFAIDSLLHTLRPASSAGEGIRERESWRVEPPSHTHSTPPPRLCNTSYSCVSSSSSASPESDLSDEDWRGVTHVGKRLSDREFMSDRYNDSCPPPNKSAKHGSTPPWELPTSYAKYTPPNAVAPPSMRFNGNPFMPLGSIPFYSYGGTHVTTNHLITTVGHAYWPILQSGPVSIQAPPLLMDLDSMLQSVPPNKSVFDVLGPTSQTPHLSPNQYALQNGPSLCKFSL